MTARKLTAIGIILVVAIGLGAVGVYISLFSSNPNQVPPPAEPPGDEPEIIINEGLAAWAEATYWQDFMSFNPEEGPPFYTRIWINVTNTGNITVTNFHAVRVTIYFYNDSSPLVTLDLESSIQYFVWPEIRPGESVVFEYTNVRNTIYSPSIEQGTLLYSRVLTRWENGSEMILTTPPSALLYTQ